MNAMLGIILALTSGASISAEVPANKGLESILAADNRLAAVSHRLVAANAQLCQHHMPLPGFEMQSSDQYPAPDGTGLFDHAPVAVAVVVPGSPAALAGMAPGDGIESINGNPTRTLTRQGEAPVRDAAFDLLAGAPTGTIAVELRTARGAQTLTLAAPPACRVLTEIRAGGTKGARSNGKVIQVDFGLTEIVDEQGLAVVVAHELAHSVLEHRRRLETLGVSKGFFGEFGRNQRLNRQMEVEADRLSAHLLANAGWDPAIAASFWRSRVGRRIGGTLLHSAVYPSAEGRAQLIDREVADYLGGDAPSWPGHLLSRRNAAD